MLNAVIADVLSSVQMPGLILNPVKLLISVVSHDNEFPRQRVHCLKKGFL